MASYYTGVPIGGSIWFFGGLVGLPIPDNFVENRTYVDASSDPRKAPEFTRTSLNYLDKGYLGGYGSLTPVITTGSISVTLALGNIPVVTKTKTLAELDVPTFTPAQVGGMFDVTLNGTTTGLTSDGVTGYEKREAIFTTSTTHSWSFDTVDALSGSDYTILATSTTGLPLNRSTARSHDHDDYKAGTNETHTHTGSPNVTWSASSAINVALNGGTQSSITYDRVRTPSTGAVLITRIW